MNWIPVSSSNLEAVAYDAGTNTLYIRFNRNGTYAYYGATNVYQGLLSTSSHGSYHAAYIKNSYRYERF